MSYIEHLKTCNDCQQREANNNHNQNQKPTIRIKSASTVRRERALSGLAALITGASYGISYTSPNLKGARRVSRIKGASCVEKSQKLKELGRLIRGQ